MIYRAPGAVLMDGNNVQLLHELGDRGLRVQLIGGSPPYDLSMGYHGLSDDLGYAAYRQTMVGFGQAAARVAGPGTRLWLNVPLDTNLGGKRPIMFDWHRAMDEAGWTYQTTVMWLEGNVSRRTAWGSWRSPSAPFINTAAEAILVYYWKSFKRADHPYVQSIQRDEFLDWTLGLWKFGGANPKRHGHPAPFPEELPRRVIKMYSYPNDVILDPWNGSGTTTVVAAREARFAIGLDQSPLYVYRAYRRHLGDPKWFTAEPETAPIHKLVA